jgi:putative NADH-flavin reductase
MQDGPVTSRIGIVGVSGGLAEQIATEAAERGHHVTVFVDDPQHWAASVPALQRRPLDLSRLDVEELDVIVNAHQVAPGHEREHLSVNRHLLSLLSHTRVRLITVGAPGHLFTDDSRTSIYWQKSIARGPLRDAARTLERAYFLYKISRNVRWTYVAPPIELVRDGERTGRYRAGGDVILTDEQGLSRISHADYAVALVDEVETSAHPQRMFTVAS